MDFEYYEEDNQRACRDESATSNSHPQAVKYAPTSKRGSGQDHHTEFSPRQQTERYRNQHHNLPRSDQPGHAKCAIQEHPRAIYTGLVDSLHYDRPIEASHKYDRAYFKEGERHDGYKNTEIADQRMIRRQQQRLVQYRESGSLGKFLVSYCKIGSFHDDNTPHNYNHFHQDNHSNPSKVNRAVYTSYRGGSHSHYKPNLRTNNIATEDCHPYPERIREPRSSPHQASQNSPKARIPRRSPILARPSHSQATKENTTDVLDIKTTESSPELLHKRFIVLKCLYYDIIAKAKYESVWPTRRSTADRLNDMMRSGDEIYLFFSLDNSQHFQGTHFLCIFQASPHFLIS